MIRLSVEAHVVYWAPCAQHPLLVGCTRSRCTAVDPAPVAWGSFLLAIAHHVNGCKNITEPVGFDRLPPLVPAATGEGIGGGINLQRNLWEPYHHAPRRAAKSSTGSNVMVAGSQDSLCLNKNKPERWKGHRGEHYLNKTARWKVENNFKRETSVLPIVVHVKVLNDVPVTLWVGDDSRLLPHKMLTQYL